MTMMDRARILWAIGIWALIAVAGVVLAGINAHGTLQAAGLTMFGIGVFCGVSNGLRLRAGRNQPD